MNMIKMGANLILEGISQLGKNRITEHGNLWTVIGVSSSVKALNNLPGVLLQSLTDRYLKWMQPDDDKDFNVISDDDYIDDSNLNVVGE